MSPNIALGSRTASVFHCFFSLHASSGFLHGRDTFDRCPLEVNIFHRDAHRTPGGEMI
jgi:hypothetical protein